jgi:hypothetical protein
MAASAIPHHSPARALAKILRSIIDRFLEAGFASEATLTDQLGAIVPQKVVGAATK